MGDENSNKNLVLVNKNLLISDVYLCRSVFAVKKTESSIEIEERLFKQFIKLSSCFLNHIY